MFGRQQISILFLESLRVIWRCRVLVAVSGSGGGSGLELTRVSVVLAGSEGSRNRSSCRDEV